MKIPLIMLVLSASLLTSACADLACSARTDVDPYGPMLDQQRCVIEANKQLAEHEKVKKAEQEQQLKAAMDRATKHS
ncbi:hypothetical protein [Shewanella sp. KJ2020]|uniref:hypothetical protein n=1 Tax=Shewanella sp. KJ2020 TaxID=2919172 RepID=UPI0020A83653|nr:hypothetical protein [Shewanella sp. KJ2020]MCP3129645.1 hypothetical protein [Shewanella sp. KJ2020]